MRRFTTTTGNKYLSSKLLDITKMIAEYPNKNDVGQRAILIEVANYCYDDATPTHERQAVQASILALKNQSRRDSIILSLTSTILGASLTFLAPPVGLLFTIWGNSFAFINYSEANTL